MRVPLGNWQRTPHGLDLGHFGEECVGDEAADVLGHDDDGGFTGLHRKLALGLGEFDGVADAELGDAADFADEGLVTYLDREAHEAVAAGTDEEEGVRLDAGHAELDVLAGGKCGRKRSVRRFEVETDDASALLGAQGDTVGPPAACRCCHMHTSHVRRRRHPDSAPARRGRTLPASLDWGGKNFHPLFNFKGDGSKNRSIFCSVFP